MSCAHCVYHLAWGAWLSVDLSLKGENWLLLKSPFCLLSSSLQSAASGLGEEKHSNCLKNELLARVWTAMTMMVSDKITH